MNEIKDRQIKEEFIKELEKMQELEDAIKKEESKRNYQN